MPDNLEPNADQENVIKPLNFKPVDAGRITEKPWIKPVTAILGCVFLLLLIAMWYVFTARSVYLSFEPVAEHVEIKGGIVITLGERYLMRPGEYLIQAKQKGYRTLEQPIEVSQEPNQKFDFQMLKLPGRLFVRSVPEGAAVLVDGEAIGKTPVTDYLIEAGRYSVGLEAGRYISQSTDIEIEGKDLAHQMSVELKPAWSDISMSSEPPGATILVDNEPQGYTPKSVEVMQGERLLILSFEGYKNWQQKLSVEANQSLTLPMVRLEPLDGVVRIQSEPSQANVMVDDVFRGQTPLSLSLKPKQRYQLNLFKPGYLAAKKDFRIISGSQQSYIIKLEPIVADIRVVGYPADAKVFIDNQYVGTANQVFSLPTEKQMLEIRKEGYVSYQTYITPRQGLEQQVKVRLKTLEQAKWEAVKPIITLSDGQQLKLFRPGSLTMGASRREAGRRANESLKQVSLNRAFYIGTKEVTNQHFRLFEKLHSSGNVEGYSLDGDSQPVVKVSWQQAALYCNWLSEREGLPLAYRVEEGEVVGFNEAATGYRLPTEAEWAWVARNSKDGLYKYPWGAQLPPTEKSGNYADRSAAFIIGRIVTQYDDKYAVTAPVGSFLPNQNGLYDLGGNVSEWAHDYYSTGGSMSNRVVEDPLGPDSGKYHVIRGSSWAHGSIAELRLSYRDYGNDGRNDLGFRLARFLE